jgi:hypothetical protein
MRKVFTISLLGSLLFVLGTCGNSSRSFVRIIHASPDAGNLDITLDGTKILSATPYASGSNYFTVAPGSRHFQINQSGKTAFPIDTQITFSDGTYYTIAIVGLVTAPSSLTFQQMQDDHSGAASGQVKFHVLHLDSKYPESGVGTSAVDVYITSPATTLAPPPSISGVNYLATQAFSLPVPTDVSTTSGSLRVRVAQAGDTTPDSDSIPGWDSGTVVYTAGQVRTYVLLNNPTGIPSANQFLMLKDLN